MRWQVTWSGTGARGDERGEATEEREGVGTGAIYLIARFSPVPEYLQRTLTTPSALVHYPTCRALLAASFCFVRILWSEAESSAGRSEETP